MLRPTALRPTATRPTAPASRITARLFTAGLVAACLSAAPLTAQAQPKPEDKPAAGADPIIAKIGSEIIHLSDANAVAETLPPQTRQMPRDQLMPKLVDQMVDTAALAQEARKIGIDKDPTVQRQLVEVQERTLVSAMLEKEVGPRVTEAALKARFDKLIASQPPGQEVHARHILVDDEATAKKIIAELKKGGDFAALSKQYSKDAAAVEQGGDLGYFKAGDMVPEFATATFALKDKEITPTPVHTQFGWHVIQTLDHRAATPPTFDQSKDQLRQQMINEEVHNVLLKARADTTIERFNLDGSPIRATDQAVPPPAK